MKKNMLFNLFAFMIAAAPAIDIATRCGFIWGEPDFPSEEEL